MSRSARGLGLLLSLLVATAVADEPLEGEIAYRGDAISARLTVYPPYRSDGAPPLLVFVVGGFWGARPRESAELERLLVRPLRAEGVAVALVRHRPAPASHPADYAHDVAAAVGWLIERRERLGFDAERVVLSGHGSGAQLAARVGTDPVLLAEHGVAAAAIAAVVPISGVYDLEAAAAKGAPVADRVRAAYPTAETRRAASPGRVTPTGDTPLVVALAAASDVPGWVAGALAYTEALRAAGAPRAETFVVPGRDHDSVLDLRDGRNAARAHLLALAGVGSGVRNMQQALEAQAYWRDPGLTTEAFWDSGDVVVREADDALRRWLVRYLGSGGRSAAALTVRRFAALDLEPWLDARAARVGRGRWLSLANVRGARAVLDLEALRPYGPLLVVGLDGERNPFRVVDLYQTLRRYSWRDADAEPWLLARPVGAFVHFREPPPPELHPSTFGLFALRVESFARSDRDPWGPLRNDLAPSLSEILLARRGCVSCHQVAGIGGRAGHLRASDGELVGGFGLPLEEYPREVWRRYLFEQHAVAREIGASPVALTPEEQQILFAAIRGS